MNSWSARTKSQNDLRTKVKSFNDNYKFTESRIRSTSSLHNLAAKLYSTKQNKTYTPSKGNKALPIISQKSVIQEKGVNPERNSSKKRPSTPNKMQESMTGLSMRASHVSNFSQMNTSLILNKKQLEQKIAYLKQAIVNETHKLDKANKNCKKNTNQIQKYTDLYNDAHLKSKKLQQEIDHTNKDINNLKKENRRLNQRINETRNKIQNQSRWCQELQDKTKKLKVNLLMEQKQKTKTKADLANSQRVMKSSCTLTKQLEDQRAFLLLQINQSVNQNKI